MNCLNCDKEIPEDSVFCKYCGEKQDDNTILTKTDMLSNIKELFTITGFQINETGEIKFEQWIDEFGYDIVLDSVKTAFTQYLIKDDSGNYTCESVSEAFSKIGGIAYNKHNNISKPYISDVYRIIGYVKKSFCLNHYEVDELFVDLNNLLYYLFNSKQYEGKVEDILALVRGSRNKYDFFDKIAELKDFFCVQ